VQYVMEECHHLSFAGLMTIGRMNHQHQIHGPNPDFTVRMAALAEPFKGMPPSIRALCMVLSVCTNPTPNQLPLT
jgi:uncharacterized pyridoxal phosphate-containing UPF0001 family protein